MPVLDVARQTARAWSISEEGGPERMWKICLKCCCLGLNNVRKGGVQYKDCFKHFVPPLVNV